MIKNINNYLQIRTWEHIKIFFTLIGAIFILGGCSNKINNISKKENYKMLDEMAIYIEQNNANVYTKHIAQKILQKMQLVYKVLVYFLQVILNHSMIIKMKQKYKNFSALIKTIQCI
ncbi:MAG: hypothetical protein AB7V28_06045 [Arcobacteraceae bacterium]